jgi:hypothetical protein
VQDRRLRRWWTELGLGWLRKMAQSEMGYIRAQMKIESRRHRAGMTRNTDSRRRIVTRAHATARLGFVDPKRIARAAGVLGSVCIFRSSPQSENRGKTLTKHGMRLIQRGLRLDVGLSMCWNRSREAKGGGVTVVFDVWTPILPKQHVHCQIGAQLLS